MDKKFTEMTLEEILKETASDSPAPGGGSISAITASLSAALGQMVLALTYGKKAYESLDEEVKAEIKQQDQQLADLGERLIGLTQEDTDAFLDFMNALKMPKESEEEKAARRQAMDDAALHSMSVPLETAERCLAILKALPIVAEYGNKNAITDAGVASLLARAACEGALLNVKINLPTIKDETVSQKAARRSEEILSEAQSLHENILKVVYSKL